MSVKDIADGEGHSGGHSGASATWRMEYAHHLSNRRVLSLIVSSSKMERISAEQRPDKGAPSGSHQELLHPDNVKKSCKGSTVWVVQFVFNVRKALSSIPAFQK